MDAERRNDVITTVSLGRAMFALFVAAVTFFPGIAASEETEPERSQAAEQEQALQVPTYMSEAVRSSVKKLVVMPGQSPISQATTGSYEEQTTGLYGGVESGSRIGQGVGTEVGPVSMRIPIPILTYPGALIGGITGASKREIQEFRDRLTDDLAEASSQPLSNDALASDVFWGLRRLPNLDSKVFAPTTPIPEDTDAILYVSLKDITIDVQGKDAIIRTTAGATLRRVSDGEHLYEVGVAYEDRDSLSNWTANENTLWRDYANFARHYLGREISAQVFDRVSLRHELRPKKTDSVKLVKKNNWQGVSRSLTPTLAWDSRLLDGDGYGSWVASISEADIAYDVEIYDRHRLVYSAKQVPEPHHSVDVPLEACQDYRWSVRPIYSVGSDKKFGNWMRLNADSYVGTAVEGKKASEAPAYTQDFAALNIKCGSK